MQESLTRVNTIKKELAAVAFGLSRPKRRSAVMLDETSQEVLYDMLAGAMSMVGAQRGMLALPLPDSDDVKVVATIGLEPDTAWTSGEVSQSIVHTVLAERRGVLTHNAVEDTRFGMSTSVVINGLRSVLCVPLVKENILWGVLYVDNPARGAFRENQLRLLKDFTLLTMSLVEN